jgi:hypothetical protein
MLSHSILAGKGSDLLLVSIHGMFSLQSGFYCSTVHNNGKRQCFDPVIAEKEIPECGYVWF